jgi:PAS domain S-box-containing protein
MMSKPPHTHPTGHTQELEGNQDRMRQIISCAPDAIITMSDQGLITGWNPQAETIFGWTKAEALGKKLSHLIIPKPLRAAHEEEFRRVRQSQQSQMLNHRGELFAIQKNGKEFPVELSMAPVMVGDRTEFCAFM